MKKLIVWTACLILVFALCFAAANAEGAYKYEDKDAGEYNIFYLQGYLDERFGIEVFYRILKEDYLTKMSENISTEDSSNDVDYFENYMVIIPFGSFEDLADFFMFQALISEYSTHKIFIDIFTEYIEVFINRHFRSVMDGYNSKDADFKFCLNENNTAIQVTFIYQGKETTFSLDIPNGKHEDYINPLIRFTYNLETSYKWEQQSEPADTVVYSGISDDFQIDRFGNDTIQIKGYTGDAAELIIPTELDGYPVTSIYGSAFWYCNSLTSVTIPDSITLVDNNPFAGCENLTEILVSSEHPTLETIDGVLFDKKEKRLICYPGGATEKTYAVPQDTRTIGSHAFAFCNSLESVTVPDGKPTSSGR